MSSPTDNTGGAPPTLRQRRAEMGQCYRCGRPLDDPGYRACRGCRDKQAAAQRERTARRAAQGLCRTCGNPSVPGLTYCQSHREAEAHGRIERKAVGICAECHLPAMDGKTLCEDHLARRRDAQRGRQSERLARGECVRCGMPRENPDRSQCDSCLELGRERQRQRTAAFAEAGRCLNCGGDRQHVEAKLCETCWFETVARRYLGDAARFGELAAKWDAQGRRCAYTGEPVFPSVNMAVDHILPVSRGGRDDIDNLQLVTRRANQLKSYWRDDEFLPLVRAIASYRQLN